MATSLPALHPVGLFFRTLAAGTLFGLVGVLLAVPVAALVHILVDEFYLQPRGLDMPAIDNAAGKLAKGETEVEMEASVSSADDAFNARVPHPQTPARNGTPCARYSFRAHTAAARGA